MNCVPEQENLGHEGIESGSGFSLQCACGARVLDSNEHDDGWHILIFSFTRFALAPGPRARCSFVWLV